MIVFSKGGISILLSGSDSILASQNTYTGQGDQISSKLKCYNQKAALRPKKSNRDHETQQPFKHNCPKF